MQYPVTYCRDGVTTGDNSNKTGSQQFIEVLESDGGDNKRGGGFVKTDISLEIKIYLFALYFQLAFLSCASYNNELQHKNYLNIITLQCEQS